MIDNKVIGNIENKIDNDEKIKKVGNEEYKESIGSKGSVEKRSEKRVRYKQNRYYFE